MWWVVRRLAGAVAVAALVGGATGARAASYDPDLTWRTIKTEHFLIHFHQGEEQLADEFSSMVEEVYDTMVDEIRWEPRRRTELVLVDRTDGANGYARVVPYNAIVIYVTAPKEDSTLNYYEDWNTAIFTHELTHVLHMDANHGIVRAARSVVGRIASTNDLSPWWMVEGLATFQETRHTPGGRGRAAWPDMIKRTAVVETDFPPLGNLDGLQPRPPGGNLRYLFGQDFIQYIADTHGEDAWTRWVHIYGSSLPYLLPGKKVFGEPITRMYKGWRDHLGERYSKQAEAVRDEGETVGRLVSLPEANCIAPSFSPDGERLVWSCYDLRRGSAIWHADDEGYGQQVLLQDRGASYFTWRADGQAFVYTGTHLVNRFNTYNDVYMHNLASKRTTPLTAGARARDPDFSPDGSKLLMVTNRAQNTRLEVMTIDQRRRKLTDETHHVQYSTPRFSPDGSVVAVSIWEDGRRDLWLVSPEGERLRRLTQDTAIDADPIWSMDGAWLYFSSDRSGIPNIYAVELETERLYQVTNVVTGAAKPSVHPDGHLLAYQQYSHDGWDIRVLKLNREAYLDRGLLPQPVRYAQPLRGVTGPRVDDLVVADVDWPEPNVRTIGRPGGGGWLTPDLAQAPNEILDSFEDTEGLDLFGEEQDYPFRITPQRYSPIPTLLPRFVAPFVQTTPFRPRTLPQTCIDPDLFCPSLQFSLSTGSSDTLARFGWTGFMTYRTDADFFGGGGTFTINRWLPIYTFGASTRAVSTGRYYTEVEDPETGEVGVAALDERYWERRTEGFAQVSFPYRLRSTLFARYGLSERTARFKIPDYAYQPLLPLRGTIGTLSGGYRFSWSQQTAYSISREDARIFSLVGNFLHPWLGTSVLDANDERTPLTQVQLVGELREYVVNPLIPNHVLAGRAATGVALGGTDFLGNYQMGGSIGDGAFYVTPDEFVMLRGYPFGFDAGDMYWLTAAEYRLPLWQIQRGVGALPAYFQYLSAAAFVDVGNAFLSPMNPLSPDGTTFFEAITSQPLVGVGGELSLSTVLGWSGRISGRAGFAIPLTLRGSVPPQQVYLQFGGSF
jgi:Tol biopolymer transport system component